ncbi:hypothetical protein Tco_0097947 [Tanacetum coccineum]
MIRSSNEAMTSHAVTANLSELKLKKILIEKMESNKSVNRSIIHKNLHKALVDAYEADKNILDTYGDTVTFKRRRDDADDDQEPSTRSYWGPPTPDRDWNKTLPADHGPVQPWLSNLARHENPHESFDELTDTPFDFSAFVMNRLNVETLTPKLLVGPTFELIKGTCKSLFNLEYFFKEVYKATIEQLDWHNPEGQQYPHDLRKPLPLIPNSHGSQVIPFDHFINKRTLDSHIEDAKRKQICLDFADLLGSALCIVYSRRRIIAVTKLQIVEWHGYKHLDWITIRRDDDKLHTFKEGDFKRLRLQDIEDMLLLLVQGKLTNLNVEERLAFSVSLRMFTRSINRDKKNKLMRVDELHKFSDGTLNDVRTALDDRLKGIRMEYLPQTIWRQSDRERAKAMIQAIDKQLKSRRIMRSLERFVGGRLYEGDFRLLQRTI